MPTKLGQNFLEDEAIVEKIIKAADLKSDDIVIEIGPGKGILTEELSKRAKKVIAVEIDEKLVDYLWNKFKGQKNIEIIHADILKINLSELQNFFSVIPAQAGIQSINTKLNGSILDSRFHGNDMGSKYARYKLIANIPYYITSPIIRLFLEADHPPREMILTVQKEVAERITAPPGKMSKLSVSVQYYAHPEILFYIDKKYFNPTPKVDSAVIRITHNSQPTTYNKENASLPLCLPATDRKKGYWMRASEHSRDLKVSKKNKLLKEKESKEFFRIVRAGFCARRKTLVNNLSNSLQLDKKEIQEKLKAAGILPTARAQELSVEEWEKLHSTFHHNFCQDK